MQAQALRVEAQVRTQLRRLQPRFLEGASGVAKLLLASPDPGAWQDTGITGVAIVLKDTLLQTCILQVGGAGGGDGAPCPSVSVHATHCGRGRL